MDERALRFKVFDYLRARSVEEGGIFDGRELNAGITIDDRRLTLKGQNGIWYPAGFSLPISITTVANGPYRLDDMGDGILTYAYRGQDPEHRDNRGLREAMRTRTPLIYFKEVHRYRYQAIWPLIIIDDDPSALCVRACVDPAYENLQPSTNPLDIPLSPIDLRRYAWAQTRQRLHQEAFRDIVVTAYDQRCAVCRLRHPELLDAAHIVPDSDDRGTPIVQNGLSLCKIHHAAYDHDILGVSPDFEVKIRSDILKERDGPMLLHGLQELDGTKIALPARASDRPARERLEFRYRSFLGAS
ncbi:MAG TPA: HNH endonuclease [Spirochaetia bacterium]|nr:HNH endonuclease [Spirochaetia bacterium]HRZ63574.1 HNH endonuclease [Spirochaetia bacterium]